MTSSGISVPYNGGLSAAASVGSRAIGSGAAILKEAGVPFVFYTGYGELPQRFVEVVTVGKAETAQSAVRKLLECMKDPSTSNSLAASKEH